jgi:hypothetical protein
MWPNESAIGKEFTVAFGRRTVVGVVGDVRVRGLERQSEPQMYLPSRQKPDSTMGGYVPKDLVIRATVPTETLLPAVRRIILAVDPEQPISDVRSLTEIVAGETTSRVAQLRLVGVLSVLALLIAGVGIHGLLAFAVSQRSRELGVRRALGEQAGSILRRVLREGTGARDRRRRPRRIRRLPRGAQHGRATRGRAARRPDDDRGGSVALPGDRHRRLFTAGKTSGARRSHHGPSWRLKKAVAADIADGRVCR